MMKLSIIKDIMIVHQLILMTIVLLIQCNQIHIIKDSNLIISHIYNEIITF